MSALHSLGADRCPTSKQLNSTKGNGWELLVLSLIPGCKHLTRACRYRINSAPIKSPFMCVCACVHVWACTHQHKRDGPLLSNRLGHGCVALIIPLSAHNKSLAVCHILQAKLVIKVTMLLEKSSMVALFEGLI